MKKAVNMVHGTALVAHITGIVTAVCNGKYIAAMWCAVAAMWLTLNWINRLCEINKDRLRIDLLKAIRNWSKAYDSLQEKYDALLKSKTAATITEPTPSK